MQSQHIITSIALLSFAGMLALTALNQGLWWDEAVYLSLGRAIQSGQYTLDPTYSLESFRPPLFPLLLSPLVNSIILSRIFVFIVSILAAVSVYFLTKEVFNEKTAMWSLLLFTTSYLFIFFSEKILSEPLFIIFVSLSLMYFSRFTKAGTGKCLALSGLFAGLAFMTRYIGFLLILSYLLYFAYSLYRKNIRFSQFGIFIFALFLVSLPWTVLSAVYYQNPIGGFIENIKVFSLSTGYDIFVSNFLNLFGYQGLTALLIPVLLFFSVYFSRKQKLQGGQGLVFLAFFVFIIYFLLLPYKEIRYFLSFLPIISALSAFGLTRILDSFRNPWPVIAVILVLSIASMLVGFQAGWENRLASVSMIEASQYLKTLDTGTVLTQMYPYVYYFSGKNSVQFCENHFVNPGFEECQEDLITNNFNPEKITELVNKYNIKYVLFYRLEPTNPEKIYNYLESRPDFRKIQSFEEFGAEAAAIYEYAV